MKKRRVVVTGMGCVSPYGLGQANLTVIHMTVIVERLISQMN